MEKTHFEDGQVCGVDKTVSVEVGVGIIAEKMVLKVRQIGGVDYTIVVEIRVAGVTKAVVVGILFWVNRVGH